MAEREHEPAVRRSESPGRLPPAGADPRRVVDMLRQARGSVPGIEDSLAALRRRVRQLEEENERLRHGTHGGTP